MFKLHFAETQEKCNIDFQSFLFKIVIIYNYKVSLCCCEQ